MSIDPSLVQPQPFNPDITQPNDQNGTQRLESSTSSSKSQRNKPKPTITTYNKDGQLEKIILHSSPPAPDENRAENRRTFVPYYNNKKKYFVHVNDITKVFGLTYQKVVDADTENKLELLIDENTEKGAFINELIDKKLITPNQLNANRQQIEDLYEKLKKNVHWKEQIMEKLALEVKKNSKEVIYNTLIKLGHQLAEYSGEKDLEISEVIGHSLAQVQYFP